MPRRTPARWLAPIALAGAIVAVLMVASSNTGGSSHSGGSTVTSSSTARVLTTGGGSAKTRHHGRYYVVRSGDVLSGIAAKTGVPLSQIVALNPHVDAQSLNPGQKIKLVP